MHLLCMFSLAILPSNSDRRFAFVCTDAWALSCICLGTVLQFTGIGDVAQFMLRCHDSSDRGLFSLMAILSNIFENCHEGHFCVWLMTYDYFSWHLYIPCFAAFGIDNSMSVFCVIFKSSTILNSIFQRRGASVCKLTIYVFIYFDNYAFLYWTELLHTLSVIIQNNSSNKEQTTSLVISDLKEKCKCVMIR